MSDYLEDLARSAFRLILTRGYTTRPDNAGIYNLLRSPETSGQFFAAKYKSLEYQPHIQKVVNSLLKHDTSNQRVFLTDEFVNDQRQICLLFFTANNDGKDIVVDLIRDFIDMMNSGGALGYPDQRYTCGILISTKQMAPTAQDYFNGQMNTLHITHFLDNEVLFNPLMHSYSAKSRLLSQYEKLDFVARNSINEIELPCVYANEAVVKYLGGRPDDIIEYHVESFIPDVLLQFEVFHRLVRRPVDKEKKSRSKTK
jgi:DNA-directed RNA polymerase subunit H (RpoH/RPB5)